jgi:UDP-2-acetamido-3-amino-2,3-dideoxy-glucuronate N-acetyltransferase
VKDSSIMIHKSADVAAVKIGQNTNIWQYCVVLPNATIGENCNICSHVFIENDVNIGNNVTIKNGVQIWDGIAIEDNVFIGPNVTFTNDKYPRSKIYPTNFCKTVVKTGASIGANATVIPGITIGTNALIGAGSVVTKNVPPNAIVAGNPAIIIGYSNTENLPSNTFFTNTNSLDLISDLGVGGCTLHRLPHIPDMRGSLSFAEYKNHLPFAPLRLFWIYDVPNREVRGEHAHKNLEQFLICVKGSVHVVLDDGSSRKEVALDKPNIGLHIKAKTWGIQYKYSADALLLVLASDVYDPNDYIRDYDNFLKYISNGDS